MGEYIQFAGQIKLGVCQDLFYTSFDAVRRMVAGGAAQVPGNHEPAQYLNERYQWRYRFPWPDEPNGIGEDYERAMAVEAPPGLIELLKADWDHGNMRWFVQPASGARRSCAVNALFHGQRTAFHGKRGALHGPAIGPSKPGCSLVSAWSGPAGRVGGCVCSVLRLSMG